MSDKTKPQDLSDGALDDVSAAGSAGLRSDGELVQAVSESTGDSVGENLYVSGADPAMHAKKDMVLKGKKILEN